MDRVLKELVDELARMHGSELPDAARAALHSAVLQLVERETARVRERAVALCVRRGELWRTTSQRGGRMAEESRARSNEAFYLADMLETGEDFGEGEPSGGAAAPSGSGGIQARARF